MDRLLNMDETLEIHHFKKNRIFITKVERMESSMSLDPIRMTTKQASHFAQQLKQGTQIS